jgi:hypothetical protein
MTRSEFRAQMDVIRNCPSLTDFDHRGQVFKWAAETLFDYCFEGEAVHFAINGLMNRILKFNHGEFTLDNRVITSERAWEFANSYWMSAH